MDYSWENWVQGLLSIKADRKCNTEPAIFNELFLPLWQGDLIPLLPKVFTKHDTKARKPQIRLLYVANIDFKTSGWK